MRFSLTQLLLILTLCALICALVAAVKKRFDRSYQPAALAYSPQGNLLAIGFDDGHVLVWDVAQGGVTKRFNITGAPAPNLLRLIGFFGDYKLGFDTQARRLIAAHAFRAQVDSYALENDQPAERLPLTAATGIFGSAFRPGGDQLAVSTWVGAGTQVQLWDLDDQKHVGDLLPPPGLTMVTNVTFARSAQRLAGTVDGGTVAVWDLARAAKASVDDNPAEPDDDALDTGADADKGMPANDGDGFSLLHWKTPLQSPLIALSPDARFLAAADYYGDTRKILIYDATSGEETAQIALADSIVQQMNFSRDGDNLAVTYYDGAVKVWDTKDGKLLQTLRGSGGQGALVAYTPDGKTLAVATVGEIALFDAATGAETGILWQRNFRKYIYIFAPALIVWAVAWGWMQRRDPQCSISAGSPPGRARSPSRRPVRQPSRRSVLANFLFLVIVIALPVHWYVVQPKVVDPVASYLLALLLTMIAVPLLLLIAAFVWQWSRILLQRSRSWQIRRARRSAGNVGHQIYSGALTIWHDSDANLSAELPSQLDSVCDRFAALIGESPRCDRPLLALCFRREEAYNAFDLYAWPVAGYYVPLVQAQLIFCEQAALRRLALPLHVVQLLLGYYVLHCHKGFFPRPWLTTGLCYVLSEGAAPGEADRLQRRVRLQVQHNTAFQVREFFGMDSRAIARLLMQPDSRAQARWFQFVDQCHSLASYLYGDAATAARRERFAGFLRTLQKKDKYELVFRDHFDHGFDRLVDDWRQWVAEREIGPHQPPPVEIQQELRESILPRVRDQRWPVEQRVEAARRMGRAGYCTGADALIELLAAPDDNLRNASLDALQSIFSCAWGADVDKWQTWWEGVPNGAKERTVPSDAPPANAASPSQPAAEPASGARDGARDVEPVYAEVVVDNVTAPSATPLRLKWCWALSALGGVVAIAWSLLLVFGNTRFLCMVPPVYFGLWLGCRAISRAVAHRRDGLARTGTMHILNMMSCDIVNAVLGVIVLNLARSEDVTRQRRWKMTKHQ